MLLKRKTHSNFKTLFIKFERLVEITESSVITRKQKQQKQSEWVSVNKWVQICMFLNLLKNYRPLRMWLASPFTVHLHPSLCEAAL